MTAPTHLNMTRIRLILLGLVGALTLIGVPAAAGTTVTVQPGDTLGAIGARHGVSASAIAAANGLRNPELIVAGTRLTVPGAGSSAGSAGSRSAGGYTVQPGDTLGAIAARYGMSASTLARRNGISDPNLVVAGTRLSVGGGTATTFSGGSSGGGHVVQPGESLGAIAARYGTTVAAIASRNGIANPNMIVAGTRLRISGAGSTASSGSSSGSSAGGHVVQPGESLGAIAARYGTSAAALARANGISNPNMVVAGTRLRVPSSGGSGMTQGSLIPITAASSGWGAHASKGQVAALISRNAARYGVSESLLRAIAWQESGWWQGARSSTGAIGVMQLMPSTAAWLGPSLLGRQLNPYDVGDNIEGGAAYVAYLLRHTGSQRLAIASYYQGMGSVTSRGLLGETESYVGSVSSFIGRV